MLRGDATEKIRINISQNNTIILSQNMSISFSSVIFDLKDSTQTALFNCVNDSIMTFHV